MIQVPKVKIVTIGSFISKLFESRTQAHIYHLQTNSFAQHKALDEYYSSIPDLTDKLAEAYQGKYGIIKGYESNKVIEDSKCLEYIESIRLFVISNRSIISNKDTELHNIVDEIVDLLNTTIYKLKFLK